MLPATVDVVNHPLGDGSAIVVPKIREQNGTSTYKYIAPSGDELTIDVRHSLEKKVGSVLMSAITSMLSMWFSTSRTTSSQKMSTSYTL